jgi:2,3-bisphosphoglycerate-independent phosphoglycerate mutase
MAVNAQSSKTASEPKTGKHRPVVLIVMDGLGVRENTMGNAVTSASTPNLNALWARYPHALLKAAGKEVGLSQGDPGNSEVGHLNIGSGQIVYQSQPRIDEYIRLGKFAEIPTLREAFYEVKDRKSHLHLLGLLSATGVHAHIEHLFELMRICEVKGVSPYIHVILDGRDTGLKDGYLYLNMLIAKMQELGVGKIASICGRQFSMDRDHKWEQTEKAYEAMVGTGERTALDPMDVLQKAYDAGENDQVFKPTTIVDQAGNAIGPVRDNDVVIFYNYREDRARQLTRAFVLDDFEGFERKQLKSLYFLTMTGYEKGLPVKVLFPPSYIHSTIASIVSDAGLKQLHISETEKYAHVTYFFNGGVEKPHDGEEFVNIPSPRVFDYSQVPEMSAYIIRDEVVKQILSKKFDFILINFANPDMLGHTGSFEQTVKAVEVTDECVGAVVNAIAEVGGDVIVTGDHGNAEEMVDESTGELNTMHTANPVPIILCEHVSSLELSENDEKVGTGTGAVDRGILADCAPTVLHYLDLTPGDEMTGIDLQSVKF